MNELKSQIATKQGIPLTEALLRDASNTQPISLSTSLQPSMPVCLFANTNNGIQLPVSIGASQLEDNTYGMNVRANIREEGILKVQTISTTTITGSPQILSLTVPAGKIWVIKRSYMAHTGGTITGVYLGLFPVASNPTYLNIDSYVVGTSQSYKDYPQQITLDAGTRLDCSCFYSIAITGLYFSLLYQEITT